MQRLRQHLLAGAALAQQQHRGVTAGHALDGAAQALHLRIARQQAAGGLTVLLRQQTLVLLLQLVQAQRAFHRQHQHVGVDRLGQEVVGAHADRAQRVALVVLAGEHDDLGAGLQLDQFLEQLEALGDRVLVRRQAQVHRDHRRLVAAELQHGAGGVVGRDRLEAVHRPLELLLQREVVLDDQQRRSLCTHVGSPRFAGPSGRGGVPPSGGRAASLMWAPPRFAGPSGRGGVPPSGGRAASLISPPPSRRRCPTGRRTAAAG